MNNLRKLTENFNISGEASAAGSAVPGCELKKNEPLSAHTTFKVGGPAALFVVPETKDALLSFIKQCLSEKIRFFLIGGGSNIVPPDEGMNCAVVSTEKLDFIEYIESENMLWCGSGTPIMKVIEFCMENSLSGLESFAGLPGTAGGAVFMNARCYGFSISDVLKKAEFFDCRNGSISEYEMNASDWDYKKSPFQNAERIITAAGFSVVKGDADSIREKCTSYIEDRRSKGHFSYPSAGSMFKNNRLFGKPSGMLIDEAGCRGMSCGGAKVADWHGNFIINTGNATAADIKKLISQVKEAVLKKDGFELECEVIFPEP